MCTLLAILSMYMYYIMQHIKDEIAFLELLLVLLKCGEFRCRYRFIYYWCDKGTKRTNELNDVLRILSTYLRGFGACIHTLT